MTFSRNSSRRITLGLTAGLLLTGLAMAGCSNNAEDTTASPSPGAMGGTMGETTGGTATGGATTGGAMGGTTGGGTTGGGTTGVAAPPGPGAR